MDLNEVMADLLELTWPSGTPIVDEVRLQEGLWLVQTDPDQLATALLSFAFHGRSAASAEGRLVIEASNRSFDAAGLDGAPPGDYVALIIELTGMTAADSQDIRDLVRLGGFADRAGGYGTIEGVPGGATIMRLSLPRYRDGQTEAMPAPDTESISPMSNLDPKSRAALPAQPRRYPFFSFCARRNPLSRRAKSRAQHKACRIPDL
jgi:hypothetical protein